MTDTIVFNVSVIQLSLGKGAQYEFNVTNR